MTVISELERLSSAEDFFLYLGVTYDPQVLNVSRLHIMRLLGNLMRTEAAAAEALANEDPSLVRARIRNQLQEAYAALQTEGPLERRLFKVHQDAVKPAPAVGGGAFVPLSALTVSGGGDS